MRPAFGVVLYPRERRERTRHTLQPLGAASFRNASPTARLDSSRRCSFPTLIQVVRSDFTRQITPAKVHNWNLGTSRGVNLIPFARTEIAVLVPPYIEHGDKTLDGFGDLSFSAKYRLGSGNEHHGNYSAALALVATVPTGSYKKTDRPTPV